MANKREPIDRLIDQAYEVAYVRANLQALYNALSTESLLTERDLRVIKRIEKMIKPIVQKVVNKTRPEPKK